jgi:trimethylamine--corrinoid protein Co-methyltransferase
VVEKAIRTAPSHLTMYNRLGDPVIHLHGDDIQFMSGPGVLNIIESDGRTRRPLTYNDHVSYAKLIDNLPEIDMIGSLMITDRTKTVADRHQAQSIMANSTKPFYLAALSTEGLLDIVEMCSLFVGGVAELARKPFFLGSSAPVPPLRFPRGSCEKLMVLTGRKLPVVVNPIFLAGASGPIDLIGNLILITANNLAAVSMAQLRNQGTPVILGGLGSPMDMKSGQMYYGGPEFMLICAALSELGEYLQLPYWGTGGCSSSKIFDGQATVEMTSSLLTNSLSGGHLIHDVGFIDNGLAISFEALLMCNEVISMTRRTLGGIEAFNRREIIEHIDSVGTSGNYLTSRRTFESFKSLWTSDYFDHQAYNAWNKGGATSLNDRLRTGVAGILAGEPAVVLEESVVREMDRIINAAEKKVA